MNPSRRSPAAISLEEKHREDDRRQLASDVRKMMEIPEGRRILIAIAFSGGIYAHTQKGDNLEYIAGRRDAALEVMASANQVASDLVLKARLERHTLIAERNREFASLLEHENQNTKETKP